MEEIESGPALSARAHLSSTSRQLQTTQRKAAHLLASNAMPSFVANAKVPNSRVTFAPRDCAKNAATTMKKCLDAICVA
jgi:hypothetical protein